MLQRPPTMPGTAATVSSTTARWPWRCAKTLSATKRMTFSVRSANLSRKALGGYAWQGLGRNDQSLRSRAWLIFEKLTNGEKNGILRLSAAQPCFHQHATALGLKIVAACIPFDGGVVITIRQQPCAAQIFNAVLQVYIWIEQIV